MPKDNNGATRRMDLGNYGGQYQLQITNAADLEKATLLDDTCWMATSAPCDGLNCDPVFLKFLDKDNDGRIRANELRDAISFALNLLSGRDDLAKGTNILQLANLDQTKQEGQQLYIAAKHILNNLEQGNSEELSLSQIRDVKKIHAASEANGDGIITVKAADNPELGSFIKDIISTVGSCPDAGGDPGISASELDRFRTEATSYLGWEASGQIPEGSTKTETMVWGEETASAYSALENIRGKIVEFFAQCKFVAIDERAADRMRLTEQELDEIGSSNIELMAEKSMAAPLAPPNPKGIIDFEGPINPFYREEMEKFQQNVINRVQPQKSTQLDYQTWQEILNVTAPYRNHVKSKPHTDVGNLGREKLEQHLSSSCDDQIRNLITQDLALAGNIGAAETLEKLILYQQWILQFANNFVSYPFLYDPEVPALFQMGHLVMNGMEFNFNVKVTNRSKHMQGARNSKVFVMYVQITGDQEKENFEVATAVTSGDAQGLYVGRRGIFITPDDHVWDALVVDVIANPISLWESIKSPFTRLQEFAEKQAERFTASRSSDLESRVGQETEGLEQSVQQQIQSDNQPTPAGTSQQVENSGRSGAMRDALVGGGIAAAALGSSFAFITKTLSQIEWWKLVVALVGILVVLMIPLIALGISRLRSRNIGPILEACGWAVNAKLKITTTMGSLFTTYGSFPKGSRKIRGDFAKKYSKTVERRSNLFRCLVFSFLAILALVALLLPLARYYEFWR